MKSLEYVVLYADKKPEDNIIINNMFDNCVEINIGWTKNDVTKDMETIDKILSDGEIKQIIISGFEIGWDDLVRAIKEKYNNLKIKVICNTNDSLLYYEYERNNFFNLLELSKEGLIDNIAFFRKGQYEVYKNIGIKCSYIKENFNLNEDKKKKAQKTSQNCEIGIYPLNYTWDKNIFNQLCIAKFMENTHLNYNQLDERMEEFLSKMNISSTVDNIDKINEDCLIDALKKNDAIISTSFTEYVHPIFFISMELGIPCLIGNNSDFFEDNCELAKYVVTSAEDNAIINSELVKKMIENKEKIHELYVKWKEGYNKKSTETIMDFLSK